MFTPSLSELLLILVVVLVFFGSGKLPGIGQGLGKAIKNFKGGIASKGQGKEPGQPARAATPGQIEHQGAAANQSKAS
ncbi:MAG: twin-arginine translocase TatA/TatE family subunit [Desulfarculus sp.]|nr:twin-arginine translocase TatA/TatE family subunit [Desulfarculus sp.]